jgi:dTDP-glucose 4,6-dehydratase
MLLGGGGVFAVHTSRFLLNLKETSRVISVGRNIERGSHYTLDVGKNDERYQYQQIHMVFETDRLFELINFEKPDYIINYAALAYATSWTNSYRYYETNLVSVAKICEFLSDKKFLKKFVQIGTSELYGSVDKPADENYRISPTSPYAVSKLAADLHLETLFRVKSFNMNIIRPSNAYGEGQQVWRVLPKAVLCGLTNTKMPLEGGGVVKKSYLHAKDLANAIYLVCNSGTAGEIYNVGPQKPTPIVDLISIIANRLNLSLKELCELVPGRVGEDNQYWLDSSKIINDLGWRQEVELEEGIDLLVNWGKKYKNALLEQETSFTLRA